MKAAIVKYNAGNIYSVVNALRRMGIEPLLTDVAEELQQADCVLFPGQGEARGAMEYLKARRLDEVIRNLKQPVLGICVGQQLLCRHSEEGDVDCIGEFTLRPEESALQRLSVGRRWCRIGALRVFRAQLLRAPLRTHDSHNRLYPPLLCLAP